MARQRVIKPGFNDDDDIAALSLPARLFYILLWGHLDKQGLIEDTPRSLRAKIYPRDDLPLESIEGWRDELLKAGPSGRPRLVRITWRGQKLLYCPTLPRHSRIFKDEPSPFRVPENVLRESRERCNIWVDEEGNLTDPPSPAEDPTTIHEGPTELPPNIHVGSTELPRGSHEGPTELPPNSHDSSSSSASVSASVLVSVSAPAGRADVDNSAASVDNSPSTGGIRDSPTPRPVLKYPATDPDVIKAQEALLATRVRNGLNPDGSPRGSWTEARA